MMGVLGFWLLMALVFLMGVLGFWRVFMLDEGLMEADLGDRPGRV